MTKLILLNYSNFNIAKIVVNKIKMIQSTLVLLRLLRQISSYKNYTKGASKIK